MVYLDRDSARERSLCLDHWDYAHSGVDGVFHELVLAGQPWRVFFDRSARQVADRHAEARKSVEAIAPAAAILFDWTIDGEVEPESLRAASELEWRRLQKIYGTKDVLSGDDFWQARNQAHMLRAAMVHSCRGKQGVAKRWQLELTPDPLTMCGWCKGDETCGRIFADTLHAKGGGRSYWRSRCDDHRLSSIHSANR